MALPSTRFEYRIALSHVDRGVSRDEAVIVARHPSETAEHAVLRVLAWCLLAEEGLGFGPGLCDPDAADLWTRDLTGRLTTWVECGAATGERVRRLLQHHPGLALHVVLDDERRAAELRAELQEGRALPRHGSLTLWRVPHELVASLAATDERRQRWSVTVVGDHLYIDAGGATHDGAVTREDGRS